MKYLEYRFTLSPMSQDGSDLLVGLLAEIGFDTFTEEGDDILAYIPKDLVKEDDILSIISNFPFAETKISYAVNEPEDKNWNEEWEKNFFQPIVVENQCVIHSTFHKNVPQAVYDIIINPQMAFGTGHHETTRLILMELLAMNLQDKMVLDMGCGTSILAILAKMRGAKACTAIDIDDWCVRNSLENIELNHVEGIEVFLGDASSLSDKGPFDLIIANINRNILLQDMQHYVKRLHQKGELLMSGFYVDDLPLLKEEASKHGLHYVHHREEHNWCAALFQKD